jgi:hypothetical protein
MSWFFRRPKQSPVTPVNILSDDRFLSPILDHCTRHGFTAHFDNGVVHYSRNHNIRLTLGLATLADSCAKSSPSAWPSLIDAHLTKVFFQHDDLKSRLPDLDDFSAVRPFLSLQFFPDDNSQSPIDRLVTRPDLPGLATTLILDLPDSAATIPPEQAACWGISREELFNIALENLDQKRPRPNMVAVQVKDIGFFTVTEGPEFTTPPHVLLLHRYRKMHGPGGTLVTVPTVRHFLSLNLPDLSNPDPSIPRLARMMLAMSDKRTESNSRPLTQRLYWNKGSTFTEIPHTNDPLHARFTPPPDLQILLPE